jgi:hypothetical protein
MIICHGIVPFWSGLFGVLEAACICKGMDFSRFGKFSVIVSLNILQIPFAYTSSPSLMPMILMFGLLVESVSSCIFFSQVLSCLTNSSLVFPLIISSRVLRFCLLLVLFCWIGLPFCFAFLFHSFFLRFSVSWVISCLM